MKSTLEVRDTVVVGKVNTDNDMQSQLSIPIVVSYLI